MTWITIQCRLVATESARQQLWKLMAELNTPLINELLVQVGQHSDFEKWRQKGKLPANVVSQLWKSNLKSDPRFIGQPSRFYASAIHVVDYIYKSCLALQKRLQQQMDRKIRWQEILKSDAELVEASGYSLDIIRTRASEILAQTFPPSDSDSPLTKGKKSKKAKKSNSSSSRSLFNNLFEAYRETEDILVRCAISYLLKNGCKVSDKEEDSEKFAERRRKLEIQIQRLTEKLTSRMPKGRDLTHAIWLETLAIATTTVPQDEAQAKQWQNILLTWPKSLPFPLVFETQTDLVWSKNQKGRLCVKFPGLSDLTFQLYCDRRQLHWFERFLEDQQTKRNSRNQHSSSLFTLRNAHLAWQQGKGKGEPWNAHRLILHCCVDTRLWTGEGTEQVRQEKTAKIEKIINRSKKQGFIQRQQSTLARINHPFERPSRPVYQGQAHILVGVSLGLDKPATVAVVDAIAEKVLTYRSTRQLLGDNYELLNRQRRQQQSLSHKRHKAQKSAANNQFGESELGQYVDRLLAKEIVAIARTYQAGSIVLPELDDTREMMISEIQARAEAKCPNYVEGQEKYAKQYRISIHKWSYGRLKQNIQSQAAKAEIVVEEGKQQIRASPQEQARKLAIAAYQSRQI